MVALTTPTRTRRTARHARRAVVRVGCLGAGEGAGSGELPDAGWHLPDEAHLDSGQQ